MRKTVFLLAAFMLLNLIAVAQKDAPVAGHAATLFDLLKKDYNGIAEDNRDEEISRDRSTAIGVFKNYIAEEQKKVNKTLADDYRKKDQVAKNRYKGYTSLKENYDVLAKGENKNDAQLRFFERLGKDMRDTLKQYFKERQDADNVELEMIREQYSDNDFIKSMVEEFMRKYQNLYSSVADDLSASNSASSIQKAIPFIGGDLDFTTAIDGLGRFLANRIKEELTVYVIDRIKKWLQNPSETNPLNELKVLLPRTTSYIMNFGADQVLNFINEIKQYIEDDLNKILPNAAQLKNTPRFRRLLDAHPDIDFAFEALDLIPDLSKLKNPVDYFTFLENSRNISRWRMEPGNVKPNIANAIYLTGLLSRSLLVIDNGELRFAGVDFITTYMSEPKYFKLYAGFLRQQNLKYYKLKFNTPSAGVAELETLLKNLVNKTSFEEEVIFYKTLLTDAGRNAEKIFNTAMDIRKANKAGQKPGADTVYQFVESIINFSEQIGHGADTIISRLNGGAGLSPLKQVQSYFSIAHTTNEIVFDLRKKKYSTALIKTLEISSLLLKNDRFSGITNMLAQLSQVRDNKNVAGWHSLAKFINDNETGDPAIAIPLSSAIKTAAAFAEKQLAQIEIFYKINAGEDKNMLLQLQQMKELCRSSLQQATIQRSGLTAAVEFFKNKEARNLLISYYSGVAVEAGIVKIKAELASLKINTVNDKEIELFNKKEIDSLASIIQNFATGLYMNYINDGNLAESGTLAKTREDLEDYFQNYVRALPDKFKDQLNPNLLLIIHFVNDMAMSQSAEDVEKAINAFALPSGSYSIKRKAYRNFSINSYPGLLGGLEFSSKPEGTVTAGSIGFTAPVGISFSWRLGNKGTSLGLFVPIIDIAAVTRLRLDNSKTTQALPELNFKNILAPGFYVSYGLKNSPISLNIGGQYGPELKEIFPDNTTRSYESFRFGIGLTLDIPLFNLFTSPSKK